MQVILQNRHILLFLFLKALLLVFNQPLHAQQPELGKEISVNFLKTSLEEVFEEIESKSGINFSYSSKTIDVTIKITYSANSKPVKKIIDDIASQSGIKYELIGGYFVLSQAETQIQAPASPKPKKYTISGIITDETTKETLIGAAIYNKETGTGTLSNNYGFFSLTLPEGNYELETSYLGYSIAGKTVTLTKNLRWNISLEPIVSLMEEVVVTSFDKEEIIFSSLAGQNNITSIEVERKTAALGETDMLRSLDQLPGINFQNEGSSYFFVRGGNRDQNLILLDEATLYNPSHILGLFTPIIPEAVKHTEIYKADFPIQYGGRLSSVIDIRTKDGNMKKFSGAGSIGMVSTRLSLEGPFKKNSSSYFISFRRSHLGVFVKAAEPDIEDFFFSDFTSKFNIKLGERDRLYLTLYRGKDKFINSGSDNREGLEWGNSSLTLRWNHIYGKRLFSNTTFYSSKYEYFFHTNYDEGIRWNSHISSNNLKSEFTYFLSPKSKLRFGVDIGAYLFNPGEYNAPDLTENHKVSRVNSSEVIIYYGHEYEITKRMKLNYGLRISSWSDIGEAFSIRYDENYTPTGYENYEKGEEYYNSIKASPRLSISFKTGAFSSIKASYNRSIQHINLINNGISPFNSLEVWLPSGPNIKPQHANIYNLGYIKSFLRTNIDIQTDIFYKQLYNQSGYKYHAEMLLNPYIEGEIRQGNGKAYGFEILIKRTLGKVSGQIGYSFTRSKLKIDGLNGNREYYSRQDKPVDFSFLVNYRIRPRWSANLNLSYGSGLRYTTPTGFYYYRGAQIPLYTEQNNQRLPDYRRIDIGTNIRLNKIEKHTAHYLTINIYNFFARKNPMLINFNKIENTDGNIIVPADKLNPQEQIVTYRYVYTFAPSVTYNLKF